MSSSEKCVLDASALLAYLQSEPGSDKVEEALASGALVSAVNWSEVLSKIADIGQNPFAFSAGLREQGLLGGSLTVLPFDERQATMAAQLRPATRSAGLSFADRAPGFGVGNARHGADGRQVMGNLGVGCENYGYPLISGKATSGEAGASGFLSRLIW